MLPASELHIHFFYYLLPVSRVDCKNAIRKIKRKQGTVEHFVYEERHGNSRAQPFWHIKNEIAAYNTARHTDIRWITVIIAYICNINAIIE
jgi:hypothetical protein